MRPERSHVALLAAGLAAAAALAPACASCGAAGEKVDDAAITSTVKAKLAEDREVNPFDVDVDTRDGVVRLSGIVDDEQERRRVEELARATGGVRRVVNELQVGGTETSPGVEDAAVTSRVQAQLMTDPGIDPIDIDVDTVEGVVTLSGLVASEEEREEAEKLARDTEGVREVDNRLEVQPPAD